MIKPIMKSEFFLRLPSEDAGPDDAATGQDLLDTETILVKLGPGYAP